VHVVQENGSIVLLAENRHGIGEGASQMFLEGKMKNQYKRGFYVPGPEHLIYMENLRQQFDIGKLSTLPWLHQPKSNMY
jgi:hypothetical protein